jgi:adenine-specific DNA-methyltransferase
VANRVSEALNILQALNVPREQQNERSALTLLALLGMTPRKRWRWQWVFPQEHRWKNEKTGV